MKKNIDDALGGYQPNDIPRKETPNTTEKKPYPLTKKIGLAVLVVTEIIVIGLFAWASILKNIQSAFDAAGYQMIIFASFWGVKAVADNIKAVRGK